VSTVDVGASCWVLQFDSWLENVSGRRLDFGSPTTNGRPEDGYGGLFWRGAGTLRNGGRYAAGGLCGEEVTGRPSPWLAITAPTDSNGEAVGVVLVDHPENPRYPTRWFARNNEYAGASASFMFDRVLALESGATLRLCYRLILADAVSNAASAEDLVNRYGFAER
jgi:hypothetical protein